MTTINSSILINRSAADIFDYISNPLLSTSYHPYIQMNINIRPEQPGLGQTFDWTYNMTGVKMTGSAKVTEFLRPQKYTLTIWGDIDSKWEYVLEESDGKTKTTLTISYEIKQKFAKMLDAITLGRYNQKILEDALENLKDQME